jgi:hypothetical protein
MRSGGNQTPDSASIDGVFQKIAVGGIVNNPGQFSASWPTVYTRNCHPPLTVTVTCTAAPGLMGANGNPNLGFPWGTVSLWTSQFSLSGITLKSSATYPLRP